MPTEHEVNRLAESYDLLMKSYIVVADTETLPGNNERGPLVRAQAWLNTGGWFKYSHDTNAIPENVAMYPEDSKNQDILSVYCACASGKSIGLIRYRLTA